MYIEAANLILPIASVPFVVGDAILVIVVESIKTKRNGSHGKSKLNFKHVSFTNTANKILI